MYKHIVYNIYNIIYYINIYICLRTNNLELEHTQTQLGSQPQLNLNYNKKPNPNPNRTHTSSNSKSAKYEHSARNAKPNHQN